MHVTGAVELLAADNKSLTMELTDEFGLTELKDGLGETYGLVASPNTRRLRVRFIPFDSGAPGTLAQAKSNCKLPERLAIIEIRATGCADFDLDWHYTGGGTQFTENPVECNFDLARFGTTGTFGAPKDFSA